MRPRIFLTVFLLVLLTAVTIAGGYLLKAHCAQVPWDGSQFREHCYSDAAGLYHARNLDKGVTPYLDAADGPVDEPTDHPGFLEYPILIGIVMWLAAQATATGLFGWATGDPFTFLRWNAVLLAPFAIGTTLLLYRMTHAQERVLLFALGPPLLLYAFHNWDLIAVFFMVLALERLEASRPGQSGVALALGGAAKIYPLLAAPFLFLLMWRISYLARDGRDMRAVWTSLFRTRAGWLFAAAIVVTLLVVHVPLYLAGGGPVYQAMLSYHAGRGANLESLWSALSFLLVRTGSASGAPDLAFMWIPVLLFGFFLLTIWILRRTPNVRLVAFAPILLVLVFTKTFSLQYVLWALPLFALVRLPAWTYIALVLTDLAVFASLYMFLAEFRVATVETIYPIVAIAVLLRAAALLAALGAMVKVSGQEAPSPQPTRAPDARMRARVTFTR